MNYISMLRKIAPLLLVLIEYRSTVLNYVYNNIIIIVLCMRTVTKIILMQNYCVCDPYLHTYQYSVHGLQPVRR